MTSRLSGRARAARRAIGATAATAAIAVVLTACGRSGGHDGGEANGDHAATTTTTARVSTASDLANVDLTAGLLGVDDFPASDQVEPILLAGDLHAVGAGQRIQLCGEDLRTQLHAAVGRFSQFRVDRYAVTHSVSALPEPDASALGQRFAALAGTCSQPWTQPDPNGGQVTRQVLGGFPIPDLGTDAAAFLIRGQNDLGADDAVVLLAIDGPYVSSLTVTGPVGDRFAIVRPLELALAEKLRAMPRPGEGSSPS